VSFFGTVDRNNFGENLTYGDLKRDVSLRTALSTRTTPRKFLDNSGFIEDNANDTLFVNRIPYSLQTIQYCKHWTTVTDTITVQPSATAPIEAFAELVFAFKKSYNDNAGASVYLVIVPVAEADTTDFDRDVDLYFRDLVGAAIPQIKTLDPFFTGRTLRIGYQTCVELQNPSDSTVSGLAIDVLLCPGVRLNATTVAELKKKFSVVPEFILPSFAHPGLNTAERKLENGYRWSTVGKTYTQSHDLSTKKFFVYDTDITPNAPTPTAAKVDANGLRTTQQYKCVPLDRLKDVSGNLVLLDPATGARTLADTLRDEEEIKQTEIKDVLPAKPSDGTLSSGVIFLITALAVIFAFILVGAVYYYISERSGAAATAAVAAVVAANTGTNGSQNLAAAMATIGQQMNSGNSGNSGNPANP
jgi:hypothetical protein